MKPALVPVMLGFGVTLALVIGQRLTTDAMAVVLGVAVGVAASVPTSFLLVALVAAGAGVGAGGLGRRRLRRAGLSAAPPAAQHHRAQPGRPAGGQRREQPYLPQPPSELGKTPVCAACASSATTMIGRENGRRAYRDACYVDCEEMV